MSKDIKGKKSSNENGNIEEILLCPICQEIASVPIYQCPKGHLLCHECIEKVTTCPMCREELPRNKIRNLVVEQLAETVTIACKHSKLGCSEDIKMLDYNKHLAKDCRYEDVGYCRLLGAECDETVTWDGFPYHISNFHLNTSFTMGYQDSQQDEEGNFKGAIHQELCIEDLDKSSIVWEPIFLAHDSCTFAITSVYNGIDRTIEWSSVVHQEDLQAKKSYQMEITLRPTNGSSLHWVVPVNCLTETRRGSVGKVVRLPMNVFQPACSNDDDIDNVLKCTITVSIGLQGSAQSECDIPSVSSIMYHCKTNDKVIRLGKSLHQGVSCDSCEMAPIKGTRFKCVECPDYDLCEICEKRSHHDHHVLLRVARPYKDSMSLDPRITKFCKQLQSLN